jgi:hypothetical protein
LFFPRPPCGAGRGGQYTLIAPTTPRFDVISILKRPETLTLILAVIVSALVAGGIPERAGLDLPEQQESGKAQARRKWAGERIDTRELGLRDDRINDTGSVLLCRYP